jgi:hypothetical protein
MKNKKFPTDETVCVDDCECVYCGNRFDGREATNNNMDARVVICPKCEKEMYVCISVEYSCHPIDEGEATDEK